MQSKARIDAPGSGALHHFIIRGIVNGIGVTL